MFPVHLQANLPSKPGSYRDKYTTKDTLDSWFWRLTKTTGQVTLSGEPKKLTPVVTILPHCWLLCSRMQSYRGLQYSTEILFIDCFSAKEKSSSFSVERERHYSTQPLKISGMWPREFTILVWQAKPRDERGKIIFHTYFWIRGLPVLVLVVFPLRRAPSVSSCLKPCGNERLNVGQQLHVEGLNGVVAFTVIG